MWKLNPATDKLVKWYVDTMCKGLLNRIEVASGKGGFTTLRKFSF